MAVEARFVRPTPVRLLAPACQSDEHYAATPRLTPDVARDFIAVGAGHANVQERDIRPVTLSPLQGIGAVLGLVHLVPVEGEQGGQTLAGIRIIVGHENPALRG